MLVHAFLIKYAEIALKGKNRYRFEDALVHQMEIALSKIEGDFEVKKEQGRVYVFCPENYDYDEQKLIDNIVESRKKGKKHHIIVNAEGIGHSEAMAKRIEAATAIETRATILGHMQRGGSPTCKDRVYASMMGALAVDLLVAGKRSRVVGYRHGEFVDFDINEALAMQKNVDSYMWEVCNSLSHNYSK